eukprot:scaffold310_cov307-Pinguiococcus_pyrenoidosus.AAC.16
MQSLGLRADVPLRGGLSLSRVLAATDDNVLVASGTRLHVFSTHTSGLVASGVPGSATREGRVVKAPRSSGEPLRTDKTPKPRDGDVGRRQRRSATEVQSAFLMHRLARMSGKCAKCVMSRKQVGRNGQKARQCGAKVTVGTDRSLSRDSPR